VLILGILGPDSLHGYEIVRRLERLSDGALGIEDGALYQALHRMQERGWLDSRWGHAESGKRARFYALTPEGRDRLEMETASWIRYAAAVLKVLQPAGVHLEEAAS
jgi:transcriptional regulator